MLENPWNNIDIIAFLTYNRQGVDSVNTAIFVANEIELQKINKTPIADAVWYTALLCEGWPYVFGAWGAECTVAERKKRYKPDHETIKTACKAFSGGSCSGCKWYPNEERVRCFDCRGFTDWVLKQYGIDLVGEGATSQWNTDSNWAAKGKIAEGIPEDTLTCLFVYKNGKMQHTGFGYHGETCECSSGVQHFTKRKDKWTHWAVPNGLGGEIPTPVPPAPTPTPTPKDPTLKRGSKGEAVKEIQTMLNRLGYDLGSCGIDGDFGRMTESAVMNFQSDHGLKRDGICGSATWEALRKAADSIRPVTDPLYTIHIPHLTVYQVEALLLQYPGAYKTAE